MEIRELKIFSNRMDEQTNFYSNVLGFDCSRSNPSFLELKAGETNLIFEKSTQEFYYHFAFLIPAGSLNSAIDFLESKSVQLLPLDGDKIIHFTTGEAIYFYDPDGNIVEFIERPMLDYPSSHSFSIGNIIKLNEIGLPVADTIKMTERLTSEFGISLYEGAPVGDRFCWVGDFNGALIVSIEGRNWLPTQKPGVVNDFSIKYRDQGKPYSLTFVNNRIQRGTGFL